MYWGKDETWRERNMYQTGWGRHLCRTKSKLWQCKEKSLKGLNLYFKFVLMLKKTRLRYNYIEKSKKRPLQGLQTLQTAVTLQRSFPITRAYATSWYLQSHILLMCLLTFPLKPTAACSSLLSDLLLWHIHATWLHHPHISCALILSNVTFAHYISQPPSSPLKM